jgi:hypothetical protein
MRSCLIQLVLLFALVFCLLWFALPLGVGALATGALNASGFSGTDTKVEVSASPPPMLLTGHADKIHITSSQVSISDLHAASVDVTLRDIDMLSRKIGTVGGTLEGVRVAAPNGDPVATATCRMSVATVQTLAQSQLKTQTGIAAKVVLKSPNLVTITVNGKSQSGRLLTSNGSLLLVPNGNTLPTVTLIAPGAGNPFRVTSVTIGLADLTLVGTINVQDLLT